MNRDTRCAIYYESRLGRNDGPPLFYMNVLRNQLKLKTFHMIPTGDTLKDIGPVDVHFWIDWGEDALQYPEWSIPKDGGKTIYVASDTHLDNGYRINKARNFDYVFFNQVKGFYDYMDLVSGERILEDGKQGLVGQNGTQKIMWLPHAVEPQAYPYIETLKKYDVAFIGHMQQDQPNHNGFSRVQALDRLFKEFPNFYYGSRHPAFPGKNLFEDAAHHFAESKIVFDISIRDDLNMRLFESMATGSMLLTNWLPTLSELFVDGKHLVTYKTLDEMVEKAKYYLTHDEERQKIAEAGKEEVLKNHTYKNRVETIFSVIS